MSFWDTFVSAAEKAGEATKVAGQKAKLNAEILMVDRQINQRKHKFGIDLYAYLSPLTASTDFYASNDKLTNVIRPPLITTQKEVAALVGKQRLIKEHINMAEIQRQSAFHTPAQTWGGKMKNAGKSASMAGNEAKLHTELAVCNTKMTHIQQEFGVDMYQQFEHLEDSEGWLPTNREIRSLYDTTRQDIDTIQRSKLEKQRELEALGGPRAPPPKTTFMETPTTVVQPQTQKTNTTNGTATAGGGGGGDMDTMSTFTASTFTQSTPPTPPGRGGGSGSGSGSGSNGNGFANTNNYNPNNNYSSTTTTISTTSMNGFPASSPHQSQSTTIPNTNNTTNNMTQQGQGIFAGVPGAGSYPQPPQPPQPQPHDPFSGTSTTTNTTTTGGFPQQPKKDPFQNNNDDLISWDYD
eukprot:CAMPEP_0195284656 /NCGR_PEP_ID=MMETSP0707-20130614/2783_1 /TAXON_ID=33640 /ORGANISM="Asterionellopsis glacialis, Strain CCMP134" /LENGTH=408 /DNA_ID=CAMNT_0040344035 /DNA_START=70 /DNA_END=1296 /DNA_ORIENTATION=+